MAVVDLDLAEDLDPAQCPAPDAVEGWVAAALAAAGRQGLVAVRLVGAEESRMLNHQWRDRDRPTNVLSFPAGDLPDALLAQLPPAEVPLGDLAICAPVVLAEAAEQGKPVLAHWGHMTVHGTLHLLGHDHQEPADAAAMEALESRILQALGLPDPWADGA